MEQYGPELEASASDEIRRLRADLERRTEAWRDALRLVSEAEARCTVLEELLSNREPSPIVEPVEVGIPWDRLRDSRIRWSTI